MDYNTLANLLCKVQGCTFATIDAEVYPKTGVRCVISGERVILFTNKNFSGYEAMVKRRLIEAGKDADNFVVGDLPWGERMGVSPFIKHHDKIYLQTIILAHGQYDYFIRDVKINPSDVGIKPETNQSQGLPPSEQVRVHTYNIENITRIAAMGGEIIAESKTRSVLGIRAPA